MATVVFGDFEMGRSKGCLESGEAWGFFRGSNHGLADPRALTVPDLADQDRWITIGMSALLKLLFVVHTENVPRSRVRIISARKASPAQRRKYDEEG